jgi:hypothetical protein
VVSARQAPAHYGEYVRHWLNATYPGRWTVHGGPTTWPPRSTDLTPMDIFPVYAVPPWTIEDLVVRRCQHVRRVRENAVRRTAVCLEMDEGRSEHQLL